MTYLEIDKALVDITREKCAECKSRLESIPKDNVTEKKALNVELGMYTLCGNAGLLFNADRTKVIETRKNFWNNTVGKYPKLNEKYRTLEDEEKLCFIAALQGELYMRDQWLGSQYEELAAAEDSGDTKKIFEFRIKIGAALDMLAAWEAWRQEQGVYPHMFEEEEK